MTSVPAGDAFRAAVFAYLDRELRLGEGVLHWRTLQRFEYEGRRRALIGQRGIQFRSGEPAFSFTTTYSPDLARAPYDDRIGDDGVPRYAYQGTDPRHADNLAMKAAEAAGLPLVWFVGVGAAMYEAVYPVFVVGHDDAALAFTIAVDEEQRDFVGRGAGDLSPVEARYAAAITRRRLHQPVFRRTVLRAYGEQCAVCRLRIVPLLEAAHILGDADSGDPVVTNGVALCVIHHAAYDASVIGLSPEYVVHVDRGVLGQEDGPMLRHGLQGAHGRALHTPVSRRQRPDRDALAQRYEVFADRQ